MSGKQAKADRCALFHGKGEPEGPEIHLGVIKCASLPCHDVAAAWHEEVAMPLTNGSQPSQHDRRAQQQAVHGGAAFQCQR